MTHATNAAHTGLLLDICSGLLIVLLPQSDEHHECYMFARATTARELVAQIVLSVGFAPNELVAFVASLGPDVVQNDDNIDDVDYEGNQPPQDSTDTGTAGNGTTTGPAQDHRANEQNDDAGGVQQGHQAARHERPYFSLGDTAHDAANAYDCDYVRELGYSDNSSDSENEACEEDDDEMHRTVCDRIEYSIRHYSALSASAVV